jgi:hypothetical protein
VHKGGGGVVPHVSFTTPENPATTVEFVIEYEYASA